jgi:ABC-type multidrug transport system fused ATPase/permease subunit
MVQNYKKSVFQRCYSVLSTNERSRLKLLLLIQVSLALLDLVGVALIGVLGALAVRGVQSTQPGDRIQQILEFFKLSEQSFQFQVASLGLVAAAILISRTLLSVYFARKTLFFLSRKSAELSARIIQRIMRKPLKEVQQNTTQELTYAATDSATAIMVGVVANSVALIADFSLLIILISSLLIVDTVMAVITIILFGSIGLLLHKLMNSRAQELGKINTKLSIESNELILEVINSYREAVVRSRREFYSKEIQRLRAELANSTAELSFMPNISKYVIEITLVLSAVLLSGVQFLLQDASHAIATLTVFMAAGTRIAPALLRVQQGALVIRGNIGAATPGLEILEEQHQTNLQFPKSNVAPKFDYPGFKPVIGLKNVTVKFPEGGKLGLDDISVQILEGEFVAVVGPSGAGKTTLVDTILGIIEPSSGLVTLSGMNPLEAIEKWQGAISYVPQEIWISNGSVRDNIALGYAPDQVSEEYILTAIEAAALSEFVDELPNGVHTLVGERGSKISGGQRQRLGISRALYTNPKLIVLDEATSSLDADTEAQISNSLLNLKGNTTLIVIAHRLATVKNADKVIYLNEGKIQAVGSFQEIREKVIDFDSQAKLLGL